MSSYLDKEYLQSVQYNTSINLDARVTLHERFTPESHNIWNFIWKQYQFDQNDKILEVGCGSGQFWKHSKLMDYKSFDITLTDFSKGMLQKTKEELSSLDHRFKLEIADVENLQYENKSFDVILSHFMLYHASSQHRAIEELKRILKPTGWLGIVLTTKDNMDDIFKPARIVAPEIHFPKPSSQLFSAVEAKEIIHQHFNTVSYYNYEFTMKVDDVDLVEKYAKSSPVFQPFDMEKSFWSDYSRYVSEEINNMGYFALKKGCVQFICRDIDNSI